jgi:hypothetical protein
MALVLKDRVKETTTTTGTGSFSLAGAVTGYDSFGQIGSGNTTYYAVYLDGGTEWEVGIGTYTSPSTLSRDTILASSNSGNIVTFSAGQKTIWCDYPAGKAVYTDALGNISRTIGDISAITGDIATPDSITFDTAAAEVSAVAKLFWDDGDGVLSNGLKGGNVTLQIGTQEYARVYNDSGTTLTKGQAVYISGAQGNRVAVKLARADVEATSFGTIGLVAETMTSGAEGFIIVSGALYKLNTQGLTAGATVYLSPTTAGAVTTTKPQAPDQLVVIGWVERVDNIVGSIYVKIDNGYELDELHDVRITSPQSGNVLIYDASTTPTGVWKNANLTDGTGISITEGAGSVTIANTGVTALSAGTGISVSGSTGSVTVTNTAPDQTVSITGAGTTTVTGTYPNFTVTSNDQYTGTVTSVSALTLGTTGTDLSSTVANGTTTPVITLNVPTASATNRGALSSTDWSTFNDKQAALVSGTNIKTVNNTSLLGSGDVGTITVAYGGTGATTLTGVLKGNGTSAFTAATAGTDFVAPATATTFNALQTFSGSSSVAALKTTNIKEVITVSATAATGTINYDITTQSVLYYTTNASGNFTVNFRGSSGTSLDTLMATGESMSVSFLVTNGATPYYNSAVQVDGSSVTPKWQGGTAPTSGNASSIDVYSYVIIKTGSATFTVLASQTQFK